MITFKAADEGGLTIVLTIRLVILSLKVREVLTVLPKHERN